MTQVLRYQPVYRQIAGGGLSYEPDDRQQERAPDRTSILIVGHECPENNINTPNEEMQLIPGKNAGQPLHKAVFYPAIYFFGRGFTTLIHETPIIDDQNTLFRYIRKGERPLNPQLQSGLRQPYLSMQLRDIDIHKALFEQPFLECLLHIIFAMYDE